MRALAFTSAVLDDVSAMSRHEFSLLDRRPHGRRGSAAISARPRMPAAAPPGHVAPSRDERLGYFLHDPPIPAKIEARRYRGTCPLLLVAHRYHLGDGGGSGRVPPWCNALIPGGSGGRGAQHGPTCALAPAAGATAAAYAGGACGTGGGAHHLCPGEGGRGRLTLRRRWLRRATSVRRSCGPSGSFGEGEPATRRHRYSRDGHDAS